MSTASCVNVVLEDMVRCFGGVEHQVVPWRHTVRGSLLTADQASDLAPEAIDNRGVWLAWHRAELKAIGQRFA